MILKKLLHKIDVKRITGTLEIDIKNFTSDSRVVAKGDLFVAVRGVNSDGHNFIIQAIQSGAKVIVCESEFQPENNTVTVIQVSNSATALAEIASNFYNRPAENITIIGITGTNGKTTTATLLYNLFSKLGFACGLISTVKVMINGNEFPATHTTPDPKSLHSLFAQMVNAGCSYCFMEVSSHALDQERTFGIPFKIAVFTNLTHDHLDYHKTFPEYLKAKQKLFNQLDNQAIAILNADDVNGRIMAQNFSGQKVYYSLKKDTNVKAKILENSLFGLQLNIGGEEVWFNLTGTFNAYNILAVYAVAINLGLPSKEILVALSKTEGATGRFEAFRFEGGITVIIDYAHTPDALVNVLKTLRSLTQGNIIAIVGCGGDRDREKRPVMARIAVEYASIVIFTSDNPRNEEPSAILMEMEIGVPVRQKKKYLVVENRKEAIAVGARLVHEGDVLLVAGKGHEEYQEIKGIRYPFSDREEVFKNFEKQRN